MIKEIVEFMDANDGIEQYLDAKIDGLFIYIDLKDSQNIESKIIKGKSRVFEFYQFENNELRTSKLDTDIQKVLYFAKVYSKGKNNNFQPYKKVKSLDSTSPFFMKVDFDFNGEQINFYKFDKKNEIHLVITENINAHFLKAIEYIDENNDYKKFIEIIKNIALELIPNFQFNNILKELLKKELTNKKGKTTLEQESIYICLDVGNIQQTRFDSFYLKEKSFNKKSSEMIFEKNKCNSCGLIDNISAPFLFTNYDSTFANKNFGITYNFKICINCATKLIKFWELAKLNISNPLPLIIYKDDREISAFRDVFKILDEKEEPKTYREIIKELYEKYPKSLKNYYLFNFKFDGPQKKLFANDVDYIQNFKYMTKFQLINFIELKNHKMLLNKQILDFSSLYEDYLSVFQFEKIFHELIFEEKLIGNYFTPYDDNKLKMTYSKIDSKNSNSLLKNYLIKYRQNFYDFIYKSYQSSLDNIEFREMILDIIKDNIKHDKAKKAKDEKYYSIYENEILEKLNLLFSIKHHFKNGGEKVEQGEFVKLKEKMNISLGYWQDAIDKDGKVILKNDKKPKREFVGIDHIENDDKLFAFLCGQMARFLIEQSEKKKENKNHSDFSAFTDWQTSKLLKEYIYDIHRKYAHKLKFYKRYDKAMSIVQTYKDNLNIDDVMEYMVAGYFADNQILNQKQENENE
ncbi:MAG: hypothetical protein A2513_06205 [Sulfurimonas sp. RIFOXYD12_FULL_33_39]|uniref:hypothetical protein n=1 Tax=unclassified Sulfurimonas TaxID=2623549 RepID=UPI0008D13924|nr:MULTISPECIES: hypothetical protein [unclassified Sulfurimonas]OHE10448.1 MAG: hypothetical protein A2513_06205 [Sulfurimonas sp. RIFOXYD12_FULL_33_39]OHE14907.1 MAG: hypothetical protein A2530_00395 [Sulfurimonas sp. RIFOXYD2_FULL_34_21]